MKLHKWHYKSKFNFDWSTFGYEVWSYMRLGYNLRREHSRDAALPAHCPAMKVTFWFAMEKNHHWTLFWLRKEGLILGSLRQPMPLLALLIKLGLENLRWVFPNSNSKSGLNVQIETLNLTNFVYGVARSNPFAHHDWKMIVLNFKTNI